MMMTIMMTMMMMTTTKKKIMMITKEEKEQVEEDKKKKTDKRSRQAPRGTHSYKADVTLPPNQIRRVAVAITVAITVTPIS